MNAREFKRCVAKIRREAGKEYCFDQRSFINFKEVQGYFFCIYFFSDEAVLTVKPMYADELWWEIWGTPENYKQPLSFRGLGVYALSGQKIATYPLTDTDQSANITEDSVDTQFRSLFTTIFKNASETIIQFLSEHPYPQSFYPDISKMMYDPDGLLYLMALIRNGRFEEALEIIKDNREYGLGDNFENGRNCDSYTYIEYFLKDCTIRRKLRNIFLRSRNYKKIATKTYRNEEDFFNQTSLREKSWNTHFWYWLIFTVFIYVLFIFIFKTTGYATDIQYKTLSVPSLSTWIYCFISFTVIGLVSEICSAPDSSSRIGSVITCLFFGVFLGYILSGVGMMFFYGINYLKRGGELYVTKAVVTGDKTDYILPLERGMPRHCVATLYLPEENREVRIDDFYYHAFPKGTEFEITYSKGAFGIYVLEDSRLTYAAPLGDYSD